MKEEKRPDIALLVSELTGGGAERIMLNLAGGFVERGMNTDLLVCNGQGAMRDLVPHGVRIIDFRANRPLTSLPELIMYLRRRRPAVLMGALTNVSVLALLARMLSRVKTRIVVREGSTLSKQKLVETALGLRIAHSLAPVLYRRADARIAISDGVADDLARELNLPRQSITRIYNPAVTKNVLERSRERPEHPWFATDGPPVVLAVGNLLPAKDYPTLLRAFKRIRTTTPARLLILGEGELRDELKALASSLGVAEDVAMPGFATNPYAYMARARAFVLSSRWEGFANVVAEALACGAPIVATDCPSGPAEILDGGRYGRLVPVGDADAMADAILQAMAEPRRTVDPEWLSRFSLETGIEAYLDVLGFAGDARRERAVS